MNDAIASALAGETIIYANALATITPNWLVVRDGTRAAQAVISIEAISEMRKVTMTNPGLLVIASGLFTIAAAAYVSKQGIEISAAMALVGFLLIMGYMGTRRASVLFLMGNERIESVQGTFREATAVIRAVNRTRGSDLEKNSDSP